MSVSTVSGERRTPQEGGLDVDSAAILIREIELHLAVEAQANHDILAYGQDIDEIIENITVRIENSHGPLTTEEYMCIENTVRKKCIDSIKSREQKLYEVLKNILRLMNLLKDDGGLIEPYSDELMAKVMKKLQEDGAQLHNYDTHTIVALLKILSYR